VVEEEDIGYTDEIYPVPDEVKTALSSDEIVVFCWACSQILYSSEPINMITNQVASSAAIDHMDAFTELHYVDIYRKGDEKDN